MKINKEGYKIISVSGIICLAIWGFIYFLLNKHEDIVLLTLSAAMLLVFWFLIVSFFREPRRVKIHDADLIFAPCDGRVVVTEVVNEHEYFGGAEVMQISIFMSVYNVHVNWYPVAGEVEYFKYHPGKFLVAWHPKSSEENERTTTVVNTGKHKVLFRQIAGFVARRIVSYAEVGKKVEQNSKCGFIKFGSRVDLLLPLDCEPLVKIGDKVVGSQTPLVRLK